MITVTPVPEPSLFESKCRQPGAHWAQNHPAAARPRDFWSPFLPDLRNGFEDRCAYLAMYTPTGGTIDHYLSYQKHPELAYDWANFRFCSTDMNSSKKNADDQVCDPYAIGDDWFEILLPSLQMVVTTLVPESEKKRAEYTLDRLRLKAGEKVIRMRRAWYQLYQTGQLKLEGLHRVAPLIARAVEKERAQKETYEG